MLQVGADFGGVWHCAMMLPALEGRVLPPGPPSDAAAAAQAQALQWLREVASTQLAEGSLAVETLARELSLVLARLSGETEARTSAWEKRLAQARSEWARNLELVRAECSSQLAEADEMCELQREESVVSREERDLARAQRDLTERRLAGRTVGRVCQARFA